MNGHKQSAFQRALTDAVLEEYGDDERSGKKLSSPGKASKRGKGNSFARTVRYAVLAAVLMATMFGSVLASSDLTGVRYPAEEAKNAHYENENADKNLIPKRENEEIHRPLDIPFRFKMGKDIANNGEVFHVYWIAEDNGDFISFLQAPLAISSYNDPETDENFPNDIKWEKRNINGFEVTIFFAGSRIEYRWNDGEYFFILQFIWKDCTEEDRYAIFESISTVEDVAAIIVETE